MPKSPKSKPKPLVVRETALADVLEVPAGQFKNTCLQLLDDVRDHLVEIVVTKHGKPVARVVPVDVAAPSSGGFMRGTVLSYGDIVSPDFEAWGDLG